jgi:hypothetical protein
MTADQHADLLLQAPWMQGWALMYKLAHLHIKCITNWQFRKKWKLNTEKA